MVDIIATSLTSAYTSFLNANTNDRILLADGVYNNATRKSLTKNTSGVVTFGAQNVGGVTITGQPIDLPSNNTIFRGFDLVYSVSSGNYVSISGTGVQFTRNKCHFANPGTLQKWIQISANDCVFDHNECYSKTNDDVLLLIVKSPPIATGVQVLYNYFHDIVGVDNDTECIRVGNSNQCTHTANAIIAYNRFENISADPELISVKNSFVNIHHNTAVNCDCSIVLRQCTDVTVNANTLINCGIRMYGKNHIITRNQIIENSHAQQQQALVIGNGDVEEYPVDTSNAVYARVKNCTIENNIIASKNATSANIFQFGYPSGNTFTPTGNIIRSNIITASTGKLTDESGSADFNDNTVENNILYATGTATIGDMPSSGYTAVNPNLTQMTDLSYRCASYRATNEVGPLSV